jgi:hypothetical protein
VHGDGLADDEAIRDELADGLAGVGVGDLADLVGVEPDLSLTATNNGGGQALLGAKVDPVADACQCLLCWIMVCVDFAARRSAGLRGRKMCMWMAQDDEVFSELECRRALRTAVR